VSIISGFSDISLAQLPLVACAIRDIAVMVGAMVMISAAVPLLR
jgi:hypothetical protein